MHLENTGERLLALHEVEATTSLGKSTIYEMVRSGQFPAPISITTGRRAWLSSQVQKWIASRIEGSV